MKTGDFLKKFLILLLVGCIMLCGCEIRMETEKTTEAAAPVIVTTELDESAEPEPQPFPVTVNDVVIEASPQKVVSLSPSLTEIIFEMGYGDKIVGRGSYCDYPEEIQSAADVGRPSKPDIDAIIALSPDILFTATAIPTKDLYKLEENGIKTLYIPYPESLAQFESIYCAVGLVFEGAFDGEHAGEIRYNAVFSELSSAQISLGDFVYVTEGLTIATGDTFESSVLSLFGTNIAEGGSDYGYPKEYLLEFQPDIILLNDNYTIDDLAADEVYSQLTAVSEGKVYVLSNTCFERPSGRLPVVIDFLNEIS